MKYLLGLFFFLSAMFSGNILAETLDECKSIVKKSAIYAKKMQKEMGYEVGQKKAFEEINKVPGKFAKGEVFVFAFDYDATCIANGGVPKLIGKNIMNLKDLDGNLFMHKLVKTAREGGGWVKYRWMNPKKKVKEWKFSYIEPVDNKWFVGGGIHRTEDIMPDLK